MLLAGNGGDQLARVVAAGALEHVLDGASIDLAAVVQHAHGVGNLPHHGQVMGDEQIGQAQFALQALEQRENLRLHSHVQRRDRFVKDHHLRL